MFGRSAIFAASLLASTTAFSQVLSVDDALGVVAEVVGDRARAVAAESLAIQMRKQLCTHKPWTPQATPPVAGGLAHGQVTQLAAPAAPTVALTFGGTADCATQKVACTSDDVFVRTCQLAERDEVPLTDVSFLKTVTRETFAFLVRVSAIRLTDAQYRELGLPALALYLHEAMEALAEPNASVYALTEPTLRLARALEDDSARAAFRTLGDDPRADQLLHQVEQKLNQFCSNPANVQPGRPNDLCSHVAPASREQAFPRFTGRSRAEVCDGYWNGRTVDGSPFAAVFGGNGTYAAARHTACKQAVAPAEVEACARAHVVRGLLPTIFKAKCIESSPDPRRELRGLAAIVSERSLHAANLAALGIPESAADGFYQGVFDAMRGAVKGKVPKLALVTTLRTASYALKARQDDPSGAVKWFEKLQRDLQGQNLFLKVHGSAALATDDRPNLSPPVQLLRDSVADLVNLPWVLLLSSQDPAATRTVQEAHEAMGSFLQQVADLRDVSGQPDQHLPRIAGIFNALSKLTVAVSTAVPADTDRLQNVALGIGMISQVAEFAARRDWVGVGILASDTLRAQTGGGPVELDRSLRFVRTLLAMYQATSRDEAKAILQGALDDVGSRRRRFSNPVTVDVAALVGAFPAYSRVTSFATTTPAIIESVSLGIFAPVGVQVAWGSHHGVLLYPVDLGGYLNGRIPFTPPVQPAQEATTGPRWPDALRFGLVYLARPSRDVPVALGLGLDYRPRYDDHDELRGIAYVALEVPLFVIH